MQVVLTVVVVQNLEAVVVIVAEVHGLDDISVVLEDGDKWLHKFFLVPLHPSRRVNAKGYVSCHNHLMKTIKWKCFSPSGRK